MPPASSPSGVSRHGQLWNPQAREGTELAQASPALRAPLCPPEFQLSQPGRALVRPPGSKGDPAGRVPKRRGTEGVHRRIPHGEEQGSETVRVDRDGRIHHGETLPLPPEAGEDPACLHQSPESETKEIAVHLFRGHYTSATAANATASGRTLPLLAYTWYRLEVEMHFRNFIFVAGIALLLALPARQASAQSAAGKSAKNTPWTTPRTPDDHPDFQGVWANNSATPLERPKIVEGRAYLTEQEVAALKKKAAELFDDGNSDAAFFDQVFETVLANVKGAKTGFKSTDGETGDYSSVWTESRDWDNRTSLITDPADGRLPPRLEERR